MVNKEKVSFGNCTGKYRDIIYHNDGRVEVLPWSKNIIVDAIGILIASLLKEETGYHGVTYWAVGSGNAGWDVSPVDPTIDETTLTNEIGRKAITASTDIKFLDALNEETLTPTNKIKITLLFGENDCNGTWREFGLFGGNATATANTGLMIDKKHHPVITKSTANTVARELHLVFS